jgi:hypothetical protein
VSPITPGEVTGVLSILEILTATAIREELKIANFRNLG